MSRVVVVGGGIAGLASAIALGSAGNDVVVLERADGFTEVGAGLSLWPNALRALARLGIADAVRDRSRTSGPTVIRSSVGRTLADGAETQLRHGPIRMIHRAALLDVLRRRALEVAHLRTGSVVDAVDPSGHAEGPTGSHDADLVVGADGLRSVTRRIVLPNAPGPSYVGYTAWRAITRRVRVNESSELWGRGLRFGYTPLPDGTAYCFAAANAAEHSAGDGLAGLRGRFGHWAAPVPELLASISEPDLLHHDLYELPLLPTYVVGRVVLVGDAAHAMTPNLGQGAALALEDAVELADCWATGDLVPFNMRRRKRAGLVSRRSHRVGAVGQWESRIGSTVRNGMVRAMPGSFLARAMKPILGWPA